MPGISVLFDFYIYQKGENLTQSHRQPFAFAYPTPNERDEYQLTHTHTAPPSQPPVLPLAAKP